MEAVNDFSRGMQSDISKLIQAKNTYLEAINFRPFSELGGSGGSLVTIKGNRCGVKFPTMQPVFKLKLNIRRENTFTDTIDVDITGTWGTDTITGFVVNNNTNISTFYDAIKALPNCGVNYNVAYKDDYVMIYQDVVTNFCEDDVLDIDVSVTENILPGTQNTIWFIGPNNSFYSSGTTLWPDGTAYIPAPLNPLIPIGYTTILEDIYLFVAENNPAYTDIYPSGIGVPANDSYGYPGYIFKLQYDETSNTTTLTLIYAAYLDFTKYAPVAPSAAIGRYESDQIQRIYWSDFYNKVRTLNVGDPQLMALNPVLAGLNPSVEFDIPIMTNIISGSLPVGTYELCYRLKQSLGAITNYSTISNMVHLASPDINDFVAYEGTTPGNNSNKGIRFKLSNLDGAYDRVEAVVLFRDSKTDVCKVYSVTEVNIPASNEINVDVTTLNNLDEILLTDFLAIQSSFTHAKTVDTKDNRLFWGNVKTKTGSLASYDARAFRAKGNSAVGPPTWNDIYLTNNGINAVYTPASAALLPETSDCINEYYTNTGDFSANACYYKPGTAKLGGAGPNISYEFGTYSTGFNTYDGTSNGDDGANRYGPGPYRVYGGYTDTITLLNPITDSPNQTYIQDSLNCLKSPYRSSLLRGYQHEEIYRFGIQFYDLEGVPYFVKWIGDIKFPSYGDYNDNPDKHAVAAGVSDFRLSFTKGSELWGQTMYIKFTVDVSSVKDIISGYRIVRMERKSNTDKTILGCGILTSSYVHDTVDTTNAYLPANFYGRAENFPPTLSASVPFHPFPDQYECEQLYVDGTSTNVNTDFRKVKTFDCFEFNINGGVDYGSGDRLFIRSRLRAANYRKAGTGAYQGYILAPGSTVWNDWLANDYVTGVAAVNYPSYIAPGFEALPGIGGSGHYTSGYDSPEQPYYLHMYADNNVFGSFNTISALGNVAAGGYTLRIDDAKFVFGNDSVAIGGLTFNNWGRSYKATGLSDPGSGYGANNKTCYGVKTVALGISTDMYYDTAAQFALSRTLNEKLLALYYKPNSKQYGGNTYSARAGNEYIAAGSYIPIKRNKAILTNNVNISINTLGGDVYLNYWDVQKAKKPDDSSSPNYCRYVKIGGVAVAPGGLVIDNPAPSNRYQVSVTYYFPCTNVSNIEMRFGDHINTGLNTNTYAVEDQNYYATYHSNESDVVKYFSEPLDFVETNKWINRIYYSEVKYNNETADSWQVYKTNNFYDVEGNYGQIFSLQAFKGNLYYIQERGFGILYVNPMTAVTSDNNIPVVLGLGDTIQRHNYIALDIGTMHQWSVFRSPNAISFIDSRHKAQYLFDGSSLQCVSDLKGQRNFFIKRFHPELILRDNPIINKGVHTTYDYYHKEFITTFSNYNADSINGNEYYTIAYSEAINAYSSFYSFVPTVYFNNNRYMLTFFSSDAGEAIYVHNVGLYNTFYGTYYPSYIKTLVNDNPKYTKVFDNLSFATESVDDQVEWIDEIITPQSNSQAYSDNINMLTDTFKYLRCYNEYQNTDWTTLTVDTNLKKREQTWNTFVPRNKVDYDTLTPSTSTIFDPAVLTKTDFGERMRDKYLVVDLRYDNTNNYRFIIHNLITAYRPSAR